MKITAQQWQKQLSQPLAPFYLLSGDEPLFIQETLQLLEKTAIAQGFTEKQRLDATVAENVAQLPWVCFNRSLLAEKTLVIVSFSPSRPDQHPWLSLFQRFTANPPADKILVVLLGKLTSQQQQAQWLQKLQTHAVWIHIPALSLGHFASWLQQRLQAAQFNISSPALQLLVDHTEGNTLAVQQCLNRLSLLYPNGTSLTEAEILNVIAPASRYTVFDLVNAISARQIKRIPLMLQALAAEDTEPAIVLWALARECRRQQQTAWIPPLFKADQLIKGIENGNIWLSLQRLCLQMAGKTT